MSKTVSAAIIIDCILIILTLSFIFGNSLKNVEKSSNDSEKITEIVEKLPPVQTAIEKEIINKNDLEGIIRSMAHIFEFTLLGAELMLLLLLVGLKPLYLSAFLPFFLCLVLALADESLQMLSDRSAEVIDIIKDFSGSALGGLSVLGIYGIICKTKKKSKKTQTDS